MAQGRYRTPTWVPAWPARGLRRVRDLHVASDRRTVVVTTTTTVAPTDTSGADAPMDDQTRRALARGHTIDITTTGRKTGEPRRIEIVFHNIDGRLIITGLAAARQSAGVAVQPRGGPAPDVPPQGRGHGGSAGHGPRDHGRARAPRDRRVGHGQRLAEPGRRRDDGLGADDRGHHPGAGPRLDSSRESSRADPNVRPDEWRELRDMRLRALADAPDAFGATLAEEEADPDEAWQRRADRPDGTMIVAVDDTGRFVGRRVGRAGPGHPGLRRHLRDVGGSGLERAGHRGGHHPPDRRLGPRRRLRGDRAGRHHRQSTGDRAVRTPRLPGHRLAVSTPRRDTDLVDPDHGHVLDDLAAYFDHERDHPHPDPGHRRGVGRRASARRRRRGASARAGSHRSRPRSTATRGAARSR